MKVKRNVARCPYCHDDISTGSLYACCCGALYHDECRTELSKCASCDNQQGFEGETPIKTSKDVGYDVELFMHALSSYPSYEASVALARANSKGPLFLVGGRVYRTLRMLDLYQLHGALPDFGSEGPDKVDWDFLCYQTTWFRHYPEKSKEDYQTVVHYGYSGKRVVTEKRKLNLKRDGGSYRFFGLNSTTQDVDLIIAKHAVRSKVLPKTVHGYLHSVPLNIQAVAFDLTENRFYYTPGFKSDMDKSRVTVNNHETLVAGCKHKGISVREYISKAAAKLGFSYEYDDQPVIVK